MDLSDVRVRAFQEGDALGCAQILHAAVHELTERYYSPPQRAAWAPKVMLAGQLLERLTGQLVFVAEDPRGLAGFMSLRLPDELDLAYVRPDCAGKGVAGALYDAVLGAAERAGGRVTTNASELFRRFLEKRGWHVEQRCDFEHNGVWIHNYRMSITCLPEHDRLAERTFGQNSGETQHPTAAGPEVG